MTGGRKGSRRAAGALLAAIVCVAVAAAPRIAGGADVFLELTTPYAASARTMRASDIARGSVAYDGGEADRWIVTNPYLPGDRNFFSMIYGAACALDGTVYVAANGVVSAAETGRPPRAHREWNADNGHGLWRVAPDGRVTAFSVGAYGTYPAEHWTKPKTAVCGVNVMEAAAFGPSRWGGMAVAPNGDVYVSDKQYHMVLRLRADGQVEHVAGGGETACAYDRWKDRKESGHRDGPGRQALFKGPRGLAVDREGHVLVADLGNCALRRIDPSGIVSTVHKGCNPEPGSQIDRPKQIIYDHVVLDPVARPVVGGSLSVPSVDIYSNVHRLRPDGRVEQLLSARKGYANSGQLRVEYLTGLAYLPDGTLLIADGSNNLLRTLSGARLTDWLGVPGDRGERDINGPARGASLRRPGGLCVTGAGAVFVAPAAPRSAPLRKVDGQSRAVSTWAY